MPAQPAPGEDQKQIDERSSLFEMAHKVLLASIGAVVLAQQEIEAFVNRLVERGEIAESDGRRLLQEVMARRGERRPGGEANSLPAATLRRLQIPSKSELDQLGDKIARLNEKVDELLRQEGQ